MKTTKKYILVLAAILFSLSAMAQSKISGVVKDSDGTPLPGASVLVQGTTRGTVTDIEGK